MKVVAVVPIKLNNERLPGKNIKSLENGKPLCSYILETLLEVNLIDEVYVYCSDEKIIEYIPEQVIFRKRSSTLDTNETKMNEILKSFADDVKADLYVLTHATSPFVCKDSFKNGITAIKDNGYDSAFTVEKMNEFLWTNDKPFNYELDNIPRTQDLQPFYIETSGFYMYKSFVINNLNRRIGDNPKLIEIDKFESCDINNYEDFDIAQAYFDYLVKINKISIGNRGGGHNY